MSFDPEAVRFYEIHNDTDALYLDDGTYVLASDYDQLLALYRELTVCPNCGHRTHYALRCGAVAGETACECINF